MLKDSTSACPVNAGRTCRRNVRHGTSHRLPQPTTRLASSSKGLRLLNGPVAVGKEAWSRKSFAYDVAMNRPRARGLLVGVISLLLLTGCAANQTQAKVTPSATSAQTTLTSTGQSIWNFEGLLGRELGSGKWCVDDFAPTQSGYITTIWFATGPACAGINPHTPYQPAFTHHTTSAFTLEPEQWTETSKLTLDSRLRLVLVNRSAVRCATTPHTYLVLTPNVQPLDLQCLQLITVK